MGGIAPNNPVADWVVKQTGDHFGNYYDLVSGAAATVTRTTPKTIYDPNTGRIHDVPAGSLAVNPWSAYQAGGFGFAAVIEEARTNYLLYSYLDGATAFAAWTADSGLTAALGATAHGLYGASRGASLAADGSNRAFWQGVTATAATWVLSAYVRKADGSAVSSADMQLCAAAGTSTPIGTLITTTFTALSGGWYRATGTLTGTAAAWALGIGVKAGKAVIVDCLAASPGAFATSYIPTTTAAVTRGDDVVTVPTTGWSGAAGTAVVVGSVQSTDADSQYFGWEANSNNRLSLYSVSAGTIYVFGTVSGGVVKYDSIGSIVKGSHVSAGRWSSGVATRIIMDGVTGARTDVYSEPTGLPATAYIGAGTVGYSNNPVARLAVYSTALTDAQLAAADMTSELLAGYKGNRMAAKLLAIGAL